MGKEQTSQKVDITQVLTFPQQNKQQNMQQNMQHNMQQQQQHFVIVAIDLGTTYSGYAFTFIRDPSSVHVMRRWEGEEAGLVNQKTATCLLLTPDGLFHSFGFSARDFYHDLDVNQSRHWHFFDKFKMLLHHEKNLNEDTSITATNGVSYSASSVFSHTLRYFRDHALQELSDQSETPIWPEDVRWVITVPSIWKAPAKQFMRKAAYNAGIGCESNASQLLIALEPEAASICVRRLKNYQLVINTNLTLPHSHSSHLSSLQDTHTDTHPCSYNTLTVGQQVDVEGCRYMVVDCGGGTVDITVHQVEGSYLKEIHKAEGGPFGSIGIDQEFEKILEKIFGDEFLKFYKRNYPSGWVDLMSSWEARKRSVTPNKLHPYNVSLPFSFIHNFRKFKGGSVESAVKKVGMKGVRWCGQGGMLRLDADVIKSFFKTCLCNIKQAVGDVLNHADTKGTKFLFLVGGFAECEMLQEEMRREFGSLVRVIIPQDVSTTILKGAVYFGLQPGVISERRSTLTYGVSVLHRFNPHIHPPNKALVKNGVKWCRDVFDVFVRAGQALSSGEAVVRKYMTAEKQQKGCVVAIYCSEKEEVMFVDEDGVDKCGCLWLECHANDQTTLDVGGVGGVGGLGGVGGVGGGSGMLDVVSSGNNKEVITSMIFGDTELKVEAVELSSGQAVEANIDFLAR